MTVNIKRWKRPASGALEAIPAGYNYYADVGYVGFDGSRWGAIARYSGGPDGSIIRARFASNPTGSWSAVNPLKVGPTVVEVLNYPSPLAYGSGTWAFTANFADHSTGTYVSRIYYSSTPGNQSSWKHVDLYDAHPFSEPNVSDIYRLGYHKGTWALARATAGQFDVGFSNSIGGPYSFEQVAVDSPNFSVYVSGNVYAQHQVLHDGSDWVAIVDAYASLKRGKCVYRKSGGWTGPATTEVRDGNPVRLANGYWLLGAVNESLYYFTPGSSSVESFFFPYGPNNYGRIKYANGNGYWIATETAGGEFSYARGKRTPGSLHWKVVYSPLELGYDNYATQYLDVMQAKNTFVMLTDIGGEIRYNGGEVLPMRMAQRGDGLGPMDRHPRIDTGIANQWDSSTTSARVSGGGDGTYD